MNTSTESVCEQALRSLYQACQAAGRGAPDSSQILQALRAVQTGVSLADTIWLKAVLLTLGALMDQVLAAPQLAAGERVAIYRASVPLLLSPRAGSLGRNLLRRATDRLRESEPSALLPPLVGAYARTNLPETRTLDARAEEIAAI